MPQSAAFEQRSPSDKPSILIHLPGKPSFGSEPEMALFEYEDLAQLPPGPIFHLLERLSTMTLCRALLLADKPTRDSFASCMPAAATEYAQILFAREAPYKRQPEHFEAAGELMAILQKHALEQNSAFLAGTPWHAQAERRAIAALPSKDTGPETPRPTPRI
jgi:hypothetical protein